MEAQRWIDWLLLSGVVTAVAAGAQQVTSPSAPAQVGPAGAGLRAEWPEDAPSLAALPVTGSQPSAPIRRSVFTSFQVNVDAAGANIPGDAANEPSIVVDPLDPDNIVIAWRQFDSIASNFRQAGWAYSRDAGRSWTFPGVLTPGIFRSDPVLASDASGNFYYNSLTVVGNSYVCSVFKSTDRGLSWGPEVPAFGGDKTWMTVDRTASPGAGHIYTWWSVFAGCCGGNTFNRSTDGGQSFSTPIAVPAPPIWGTLDVSANGTLYLGGVNPQDFSTYRLARSSDARNAAASPSFDLTTPVDLGGSMLFSPGNSSPNPGGLLGQVSLAVDRSGGPTAGYVYMLCSVDPPGADPLDVHFVRSTDGGATWSSPVRVNDDPLNNGAWNWFGTLSVSPDGRIDVVWNDTRNTGQPNLSELRYSSSSDGGVSWSASQALTPVWDSHLGWPNQNKIGDYYHMVSDPLGADLAFAATFNGEEDVYYMRIGERDCNHNGVGDSLDIATGASTDFDLDGIPDECQCAATTYCQGAPNSTGAGASISWSGSLSIAANAFQLAASGCPSDTAGVFVYGPMQVQVPFGDGFRCTGGGLFRLGPVTTTSALGGATRSLDFTLPPSSSGPGQIAPLSSWNFQFWYRDSVPNGAGSNLSDALHVTFCP